MGRKLNSMGNNLFERAVHREQFVRGGPMESSLCRNHREQSGVVTIGSSIYERETMREGTHGEQSVWGRDHEEQPHVTEGLKGSSL